MLYLHVGTPKSGTTSIQKFLRSNANALPERGLFYRRQMIKNMSMMEFVKTMRTKNAEETAKRYAVELNTLCQKHETVVSSNEMFSFLFVPDKMMPAIMEHVKCPVKVICYIRRPDSYLESVYKQRAKNGYIAPDPMKFYDSYLPNLHYPNVLDAYAKYVGIENVVVRIFDRALMPNGNVIYDFADQIGLTDFASFADIENTSNPSLSRPLSEMVGSLARNSGVQANQFVNDIVARANKAAFRSGDTYDLETRRNIMDGCRASLEQVRQTYRPDLKALFSEKDLAEGATSRYPDAEEQAKLNIAAGHECVLSAAKLVKTTLEAAAEQAPTTPAVEGNLADTLAPPLRQAAERALRAARAG